MIHLRTALCTGGMGKVLQPVCDPPPCFIVNPSPSYTQEDVSCSERGKLHSSCYFLEDSQFCLFALLPSVRESSFNLGLQTLILGTGHLGGVLATQAQGSALTQKTQGCRGRDREVHRANQQVKRPVGDPVSKDKVSGS